MPSVALAQAIIAPRTLFLVSEGLVLTLPCCNMSLQLVDSTAVFEKRAKELRITDDILKKMSAKVGGYPPPLILRA